MGAIYIREYMKDNIILGRPIVQQRIILYIDAYISSCMYVEVL